jgi:hypothetical protein
MECKICLEVSVDTTSLTCDPSHLICDECLLIIVKIYKTCPLCQSDTLIPEVIRRRNNNVVTVAEEANAPECAICYSTEADVLGLPCHPTHMLCDKCVEKLLNTSLGCPVCRKDVIKIEYNRRSTNAVAEPPRRAPAPVRRRARSPRRRAPTPVRRRAAIVDELEDMVLNVTLGNTANDPIIVE